MSRETKRVAYLTVCSGTTREEFSGQVTFRLSDGSYINA
jgi:hypothetical protein